MKGRYILQIDSASETPKIGLIFGDKEIDSMKIEGLKLTDTLLIKIEEILKKNHLGKKDLDGILVNPGPGKYTGQRVGVTTANFLGFSLNLPVSATTVNEDKFENPVKPIYAHLPVITKQVHKL